MGKKFINIRFPFQNSPQGDFLALNDQNIDAIKSDLMHLILTAKGQRLYNPDFGTNLVKFIFEPEDGFTLSKIKEEITTAVRKYLPKLEINEINVQQSPDSEFAAVITINYTVTDDVFQVSDTVIINL